MSLNAILRKAALRAPSQLALLSPKHQVSLMYDELNTNILRLAGGLRELGVRPGDAVCSDLPNVCENLMLQFAVSHCGAMFVAAKDAAALASKVGAVRCAVVNQPGESWLWSLAQEQADHRLPSLLLDTSEGVPSGFVSFEEVASHAEDTMDAATSDSVPFASYNGSTMKQEQALTLGREAAAALGSTSTDRTCVSITLCHSFGLGSGVGSALVGGGAIVLPAADGIRGCGDPKQRAVVTAEVLRESASTLLFADTHIIKNMEEGSGQMALRGGLVKVSSGTEIFDTGVAYSGVPLQSIGKKPKP